MGHSCQIGTDGLVSAVSMACGASHDVGYEQSKRTGFIASLGLSRRGLGAAANSEQSRHKACSCSLRHQCRSRCQAHSQPWRALLQHDDSRPVEFDAPLGFSLAEKAEDAAFVVAISDFCYAQLCRWVAPTQWNKIHVVRCSVDDDFFEPLVPIDGSSRILLSIGRLSAEKGSYCFWTR